MEEVYNTIQLNKDIETISEVVDRFYNMIWCQQDNSFNFDITNNIVSNFKNETIYTKYSAF